VGIERGLGLWKGSYRLLSYRQDISPRLGHTLHRLDEEAYVRLVDITHPPQRRSCLSGDIAVELMLQGYQKHAHATRPYLDCRAVTRQLEPARISHLVHLVLDSVAEPAKGHGVRHSLLLGAGDELWRKLAQNFDRDLLLLTWQEISVQVDVASGKVAVEKDVTWAFFHSHVA